MGFGYSQIVWIKESASFGSAEDMSTGTLYSLAVRPAVTLEETIERIVTEHVRGTAHTQQEEDAQGIVDVAGGFGGVWPCTAKVGAGFNAMNILLKHLTGKITTAANGDHFSHTFHWNDKLFAGLSIAVNKAGNTYVYDGLQVTKLTLRANIGGPLEFAFEFKGVKERLVAAVAAPALTLLDPATAPPYYLFHHGTFKFDTVSVPTSGFEVTFETELDSDGDRGYSLGNRYRVAAPKIHAKAVGSIKRRHQADGASSLGSKFWDKFKSGATGVLEWTFVNPVDADYSMVVNFGSAKILGQSPKAADKGFIPEEIPFEAFDLEESQNYIITNDADNGPSTATGAYDGSGV